MGSVLAPVLVLIFVILAAGVGYVSAQGIAAWKKQLNDSLKERNIDVSRGGLKIGVKNRSDEQILDKLQRGAVRTMSNTHLQPGADTKQSFFMRRVFGVTGERRKSEDESM